MPLSYSLVPHLSKKLSKFPNVYKPSYDWNFSVTEDPSIYTIWRFAISIYRRSVFKRLCFTLFLYHTLFNGISTFVGHLMPKLSLKNISSSIQSITCEVRGFYTFPKSISSKVNVILWLEFEIVYYVSVLYVSHYATGTLPHYLTISAMKKLNKKHLSRCLFANKKVIYDFFRHNTLNKDCKNFWKRFYVFFIIN